nr:zinc finger, GRF-type [Tanacetum cinerariifolium]
MRYRAVNVIHGLLRARNELEENLEEQVLLMREKDALVKKLKNMLVLSWIFVFVVFNVFYFGMEVFCCLL